MKKIIVNYTSQIKIENLTIGESIEERMRRVIETNEKIEDTAPMIYTDRKDGVLPEYDIRTDRFEVALEAMDKVQASIAAKREERARQTEEQKKEPIKTEEQC